MEKELEKRALRALEQQKKRYAYQNKYITNNYDRQTITMPKGTKDRIKKAGFTVNGFINRLVQEELDRIEAENQSE